MLKIDRARGVTTKVANLMNEVLGLDRKGAGGAKERNTFGFTVDNSDFTLHKLGEAHTMIEKTIVGVESVRVGFRIMSRVEHTTLRGQVLKLIFDGVRAELDEVINLMVDGIDETSFNGSSILEIVDTTDGIVNSGSHSDSK
jgi:hypothetical protein